MKLPKTIKTTPPHQVGGGGLWPRQVRLCLMESGTGFRWIRVQEKRPKGQKRRGRGTGTGRWETMPRHLDRGDEWRKSVPEGLIMNLILGS